MMKAVVKIALMEHFAVLKIALREHFAVLKIALREHFCKIVCTTKRLSVILQRI